MNCIYRQSQAKAAEMCGDRLQKMSLLEEERQRVAHLRKMQIESEQFRYFEDQLRRQEVAVHKEESVPKVPEQTDGSCLSQTPKNHVRLDPNSNKPALPIPKPAATLAAVQSEHHCIFFCLLGFAKILIGQFQHSVVKYLFHLFIYIVFGKCTAIRCYYPRIKPFMVRFRRGTVSHGYCSSCQDLFG